MIRSIGHDATISAPHMHAHSAELLLPYLRGHPGGRGARVLDVGAGSGYLTSVLYHLVSEREQPPAAAQQDKDSATTVPGTDANTNTNAGGAAVVVAIEHIPELTTLAERNIRADGLGGAIDEQAIVLVTGDGRLGYAPKGPYDAIHVGAAARTIPPALVEQLASPGRLVIPVGTYSQRFMQVDKDAQGQITQKDLFGVVYVPLTDRPA